MSVEGEGGAPVMYDSQEGGARTGAASSSAMTMAEGTGVSVTSRVINSMHSVSCSLSALCAPCVGMGGGRAAQASALLG